MITDTYLHKVPVKTRKIWFKYVEDKLILYPAYVLNETGARIWELCDGKHNVKEIIEIIYSEFDASMFSFDQLVNHVNSFLQELANIEYIKFIGRKTVGKS